MTENPYDIQVWKRMKLSLVSSIVNFFPGTFVLWVPLVVFLYSVGATSMIVLFSLFLLGILFIGNMFFSSIGMLYNYLYLTSLKYSLEGKNFVFAGGIMSKFEKNLPYSKIQHVIVEESFWQRLFGLSSVSIETAGGADRSLNSDGTIQNGPLIPDLLKADAEKLKNEIISRCQKFSSGSGL